MDNQVAVVTGSARGIGKAISAELLKQSITVIGLDIEAETLAQTAQAFTAEAKPFSAKYEPGRKAG